MEEDNLRFNVVNDPENDFNLMIEAWIGDWCIADLRQINAKWIITFFPSKKNNKCEILWAIFLPVVQRFEKFIKEVELNTRERDQED